MTKRLRLSATTSSLRDGRCAMSTGESFLVGDRYMTPMLCRSDRLPWLPLSATTTEGEVCRVVTHAAYLMPSVLRVELDDQLLGEDRVDLRTLRELVDHDLQRARDDLEPGRGGALTERLASQLDREGVHGLLANGDDVVLLDAVGRDVHPHAVDLEVAVRDELASRTTGAGQAGAVDHVVQAGLEDLQQGLTGFARAARGLLVVTAELLLHDAVGEASLLLLLQLGEVLLLLHPATAVLAGREGTELEVLVAADEVDLEATRLLGDGAGVTSHEFSLSPCSLPTAQTRRRLGGRTPLCGEGVTSLIAPTSRPVAVRERMAVSRPEPGPLTKTSTLRMPCSIARRAAASAAICAANGVDLREPLKPTWPAEAHEITAPEGSVIEMMVLLNVLLM